jgi:hypothetical protein
MEAKRVLGGRGGSDEESQRRGSRFWSCNLTDEGPVAVRGVPIQLRYKIITAEVYRCPCVSRCQLKSLKGLSLYRGKSRREGGGELTD